MSANFIHLHNHSHYSLLDGLTKIPDLVAKAKEYKMTSLALTDHGNMYGAIQFYKTCKDAGIKPIIGCEVYISPRRMTDKQPRIDTKPYHLVLLTRNYEGYKNLIKLVTASHLTGYYYKPRIDKELLEKYSYGLIGMSACLHGEVSRHVLNGNYQKAKGAIVFYKKCFGDDGFYLEVQHHPDLPDQNKVNEVFYKLGPETKTKLVATNDCHYLNDEDKEAHEVLLSVQTGKDFDDKSRLSMSECDLSFYSPEHAKNIFSSHPEVLANTLEVAKKCNLDLTLGKTFLPIFELPKGISAFSYLRKLTKEGFAKRYPDATTDLIKRFEYELSVIEKTGFADYFLIVADFINWAKNNGIIVGPGRGSAVGSVVSYCLNITDLEPTQYGLLFERFLNPERISMPDIDIDFADDRRDEVIAYVKKKYGENHVAQIITFGTMAARGSIRDTTRALGMTYDEGDRIAKLIPFGKSIKESLEEVSELKKIYDTEEDPKRLINMAKKLEGVARHAGTHACGVVISQKELTEYLPLQQSTRGETSITTQYAMGDVETIGLLKMDFLGLSNLTVIKNATRIIRKTKNIDIDITKIPLDDKKTYRLLSSGKTTGVFQLESDGMKRYLKQLKPSVFEDIIAMVALYRPGPMENIPDFIDQKHGKKKIVYLHPKLEPILAPTYGIIVYQEQIMQLARDLGGFTMGEADVLRKAIGKKIKELLAEQKKRLHDGMIKNGISAETAKRIWRFIEPFAQYGFNKCHAACYALIAYQTAYLKANFPSEYMAALLTSDFGNLDRVAIEISECENLGIKVMPPSVNEGFMEFGVISKSVNISFGLSAIKGIGSKVAEMIMEERKNKGEYKSLEDFLTRLGPEVINKKTMESLAKSGAIDCFSERNKILAGIELILKYGSTAHKQAQTGQIGLFDMGTNENQKFNKMKLPQVDPANKKQRLTWEREFLGIYLSEHPLDDVKDELEKQTQTIKSAHKEGSRKRVKVGGVITKVHKIITKNKEPMFFVRLEDMSSNTEVLVFPKMARQNPFIWKEDNIVIVEGRVNSKDGVPKILAEKVSELGVQGNIVKNIENLNQNKIIYLTLPDGFSKEKMLELKKIILDNPGDYNVILKIPANGIYREVNTNKKISSEVRGKLEKIVWDAK